MFVKSLICCVFVLLCADTLRGQGGPDDPISIINPGPEEQEAIDFTVSVISVGSQSNHTQGLLKYVSGSVLQVSGVVYTFKLDTTATTCLKTAKKDPKNCPLADPRNESNPDWNECTVQLRSQKFTQPPYKVLKLTCKRPNKSTTK